MNFISLLDGHFNFKYKTETRITETSVSVVIGELEQDVDPMNKVEFCRNTPAKTGYVFF